MAKNAIDKDTREFRQSLLKILKEISGRLLVLSVSNQKFKNDDHMIRALDRAGISPMEITNLLGKYAPNVSKALKGNK